MNNPNLIMGQGTLETISERSHENVRIAKPTALKCRPIEELGKRYWKTKKPSAGAYGKTDVLRNRKSRRLWVGKFQCHADDKSEIEDARKEAEILMRLGNHPNIARYTRYTIIIIKLYATLGFYSLIN